MLLINTYKSPNLGITFVFNFFNKGYYINILSAKYSNQRNLNQSMINKNYNLSRLIKVTRDI